MKKAFLFMAVVALAATGYGDISVGNPSFDEGLSDAAGYGNLYSYDWAPWTTNGSGWLGNGYYDGAPDGDGWYFVLQGGTVVSQVLNATFYEGVAYDFNLDVGTYINEGYNWEMFLFDATAGNADTRLASITGYVEGDSVWHNQTVSYTATAAEAGHAIGIGFTGDYYALFDHANVSLVSSKAWGPDPSNGESNVPLDQILSWNAGLDPNTRETNPAITAYELYMSDGSSDSTLNHVGTITATGDTGEYTGGGEWLNIDGTYYWRVDELAGPNTFIGNVWMFETVPSIPVVTGPDPAYLLADAGGTAEFTVEHLNGTSYEWHKVGVGVVDSGTTVNEETITFTIDAVMQSDEGNYFCRVFNDAAPNGVDSATVELMTKRLIGHWPMDGSGDDRNVADSSPSGIDGTVVTRDVTDLEAVVTSDAGWSWVEGIDGGALNLAQDPNKSNNPDVHDYVILATSGDPADLEFGANTDFSVSVWIKGTDFSVGPDGAGYDAPIISNKNWWSGGYTGWVMDVKSGSGQYEWNVGDGTSRADYDPSGGPVLDDDQWHHMVATHDRDGYATFYIDGVLQVQVDMAYIGNVDSGFPTIIGTDGAEGSKDADAGGEGADDPGWAAWFKGTIDDVRMWNYVLDPYAVAGLYVEFVPTAEKWCVENASLIYDYNNNCVIDLGDFATIALKWLDCNLVPDCLEQHDYMVD